MSRSFCRPEYVPLLLLYGTTVGLAKFRSAETFDMDLVQICGKRACQNCISLVAQASANHPAGFQYFDIISEIWHVACVVCKKYAVHTCWCRSCRFYSDMLYCSEEHRLQHWRMKHYRDCSHKSLEFTDLHVCANCLAVLKPTESQTQKCSDCEDQTKAPWYCSLVCQEEHSAIHQNHCATRTL